MASINVEITNMKDYEKLVQEAKNEMDKLEFIFKRIENFRFEGTDRESTYAPSQENGLVHYDTVIDEGGTQSSLKKLQDKGIGIVDTLRGTSL